MEDSQRQQLKQRLVSDRAAIERQLDAYNAQVGRDGGSPDLQGFADSAHTTAERSEVLSMIDELESARSNIDAALARIEAGTYGKCERCGQEIPFERLEAIPTASLCVNCKQLAG
jgi:DnaK suppressor protein